MTLIRASINFITNNFAAITVVVCILTAITMFLAVNNIKIVQPKTKVGKVVVVEKLKEGNVNLTDTSVQNLQEAASQTVGNSCGQLSVKAGCTSLGGCVWVTGTDTNNKAKKCVAASGVAGSQSPGSNGPSAKCFKNQTGTFVPWEKYYYLDGSNIKEGEGVTSCA